MESTSCGGDCAQRGIELALSTEQPGAAERCEDEVRSPRCVGRHEHRRQVLRCRVVLGHFEEGTAEDRAGDDIDTSAGCAQRDGGLVRGQCLAGREIDVALFEMGEGNCRRNVDLVQHRVDAGSNHVEELPDAGEVALPRICPDRQRDVHRYPVVDRHLVDEDQVRDSIGAGRRGRRVTQHVAGRQPQALQVQPIHGPDHGALLVDAIEQYLGLDGPPVQEQCGDVAGDLRDDGCKLLGVEVELEIDIDRWR